MKAVAIMQGFYGGHIVMPGEQFEFDEKKFSEDDGSLPSWVVEATKENLAKIGDVLPQNHGEIEVVPGKKKTDTPTYKVATPTPTVGPNSGDRPQDFKAQFPEKVEETQEHDAEQRKRNEAIDRQAMNLPPLAERRGARTPRKAATKRRAKRASTKTRVKRSAADNVGNA